MTKGNGCDCPLCRSTFAGTTDLRVHLMVDHRKSDVTKFLVRSSEVAKPR